MNNTIQELYETGKDLLRAHPDAAIEARVLLCKSAGIDVERFYAERARRLTRGQERKFLRMVSERLSGVPLSYLTNEKEFWSLSFEVYRGVLIPRPESELIVEKVVELASQMNERGSISDKAIGPTSKRAKIAKSVSKMANADKNDADSRNAKRAGIDNKLIVDIGTGSGNIAISLAKELPSAKVVASDVSKKALKVARLNAQNIGVSNVIFAQGSLFTPLERFDLQGRCDFIVSNPPYVAREDWDTLQPEIRNFEPKRALVAGKTGLEFIRKLVKGAPKYLKRGGYLVFEIGYGQKENILNQISKSDKWRSLRCYKDLSGIPRVVVAKIRPDSR